MPAWWEQILHLVTGRVSRHDGLPDLRHLPSRRVAVERTHYLVNDRERHDQGHRLYVLRRESASGRRAASVSVTSNGRAVGYLPERVASTIAPLLESVGGAAVVNGAGAKHGSIRLRVDVPTREAVQEFASVTSGEGAGAPGASPHHPGQ